VIHEQNALPGMTNRMLASFADTVALSFEESKPYFPGKRTVVTGNPVRKDLFKNPVMETYARFGIVDNRFTIMVFGGSQGAAGINRAVVGSCEFLKQIKDKIQFLHISGAKDYHFVRQEYQEKGIPGSVYAYTHEIGEAYAVSDLIICRSGATTVAELKILNKQAVLVPFPFATANHQEFNARALEKEGKARVIIEKDLTPRLLADIISEAFKAPKNAGALKLPSVFPQELLAAEVMKLCV
jgi:UDP-N-acetylglucosamine--N-acetylmuramyl-(pentapeptide) pyrophosphoryl-undecaprenol N-acetylglucosamine transferase